MRNIINHLKENWIRHGFETFVVVVGVLIAFSLSSWNDSRKNAAREKQLLEELILNLNSNVTAFNGNIEMQKNFIREIDIVLDYLENEKPYYDSLSTYFRDILYLEQMNISTSAYETLKATGFDLIQSDKLRMEIIHLFEMVHPDYMNLTRDVAMQRYAITRNMYNEYFRTDRDMRAIPNDYEALQKNEKFINWLYNRRAWKISVIEFNKELIEPTELLIKGVEQYLNR